MCGRVHHSPPRGSNPIVVIRSAPLHLHPRPLPLRRRLRARWGPFFGGTALHPQPSGFCRPPSSRGSRGVAGWVAVDGWSLHFWRHAAEPPLTTTTWPLKGKNPHNVEPGLCSLLDTLACAMSAHRRCQQPPLQQPLQQHLPATLASNPCKQQRATPGTARDNLVKWFVLQPSAAAANSEETDSDC